MPSLIQTEKNGIMPSWLFPSLLNRIRFLQLKMSTKNKFMLPIREEISGKTAASFQAENCIRRPLVNMIRKNKFEKKSKAQQ